MSLAAIRGSRLITVLAGLFVLLGILVLAGWLYFQVVQPGQRARYFVFLSDVSGLKRGTEVQVAGYPVGEISGISPDLDNIDDIDFRVDFVIDKLWPIPVDSTVAIENSGLLGTPVLALNPGKTDVLLEEGGRLLTVKGQASIQQRVMKLLDDEVPKALKAMIATLNELQFQMESNVPTILHDTRYVLSKTAEAVATLSPQMTALSQGLGDLGRMMSEVSEDQNSENIQSILENLKRVSANLDRASRELNQTMSASLTLVESGERVLTENEETISNTLQDSEFAMQTIASNIALVLGNLERSSQELADLVAEIRANPTVLFRGVEGEPEPAFE